MKYFKKIIGKKCYLSPINIDDAEKYTEWINDLEVAIYLNFLTQLITLEKEKEILEKMIKENDYIFSIVDFKTNKLIGSCALISLDFINKNAVFGIFIGNKKYWNKGYGEEATKLLLDYGFNILNLNNIMLSGVEYNKRAIKCYEKCGFKIIGRRRKSKIVAGKIYDMIYMDIVSDEFKSIYIKNIIK